MRAGPWLLLCALAWLCAACATRGLPASGLPASGSPPIPNAGGAFIVWGPASVVEGRSLAGAPLDTIEVHGGETLRLHLAREGVMLGERVRAGAGFAETWSTAAETERVLYVRPTAFATTLLLPRGAVARAFVGHSSDPGYYWFDLEARVLAWATGPLLAPFPLVAPAARLDVDGFVELDRVLEESVAAADASERERAMDQARAVRRVAGLRAVRALRPAVGYPYFFDAVPPANLHAKADEEGHAWYTVANEPLTIDVDGPAILHLWTKALRDEIDATVDLRVLEGDRERAASGSTIPRASTAIVPSAPPPSLPLRRALVHVPPGRHSYRVVLRGGSALVYPLIAKPVVHLEGALTRVKSEDAQLATAREACAEASTPGLCALALALMGEDRDPSLRPPRGARVWSEALAASSLRARAVAQALAAGGPRDPTLDLELRAGQGDAAALSKLSDLVASSTDAVVRTAWAQGLVRGTRWSVVHREPDAERWSSVAFDEHGACAAHAEAPWPEVTSDERTYATARWHGASTVELMVSSSCADPNPLELAVDGEHLVANPSEAFVHWHVRVREESARVSLVRGDGHVYAMPRELAECGARWEAIHAPRLASTAPRLAFKAEDRSPGLEIWLRDGALSQELTVLPLDPARGAAEGVRIAVSPTTRTMMALDGHGDRWWRAARVGLPAWASDGVTVRGGDGLAVRGLVRVPHPLGAAAPAASGKPAPAILDEEVLVALTRRLLAAAPAERGRLHLERALMLAAGGAARGAVEDAEIAHALGARGPNGEDAVALVHATIALRAPSVEPLPVERAAYGVEADFDPAAKRCVRSEEGARARIASVAAELAPAAKRPGGEGHAFSAALAARVVEAVQQAPLDPRGSGLVGRALADSRWKLRVDAMAGARRVAFPDKALHRGPVEGDGELRPRVAAGGQFDEGSFATIVPERSANAVLSAVEGASARIDVACVARSASAALAEQCPLEIKLGAGPPLRPSIGADGRVSVPLKLDGTRRPLVISLAKHDRWMALTRIVFDRRVPGTTKASDGSWVLTPPHVEHRYVVNPGHELVAELQQPGVVRVDAVALESPAEVVVDVGGRQRTLPTDGTPVLIALLEGGRLSVKPTGHAVSVAIAERVPNEPRPTLEPVEPDAARAGLPRSDDAPSSVLLDPSAAAPWRDEVRRSPRPLTPFESSLGTVVAAVGGVYGTIREGVPSLPASQSDGYMFAFAEYRRRVESIGLWTDVGMYTNIRYGEPTYGASLILYEELEKLHVRLSGTLHVAAQRIDHRGVRVFQPRGFAEYSWRATRDFFVLPRLGFDGTYATLVNRPSDLSAVDDNVFNPYRAKRPTFLFAQVLLWFAPHFNDIFYLRNRVSYDPLAGQVSHVSVRPGLFVALGQLDATGYLDGTWYAPTDSVANRSRIDELLGGTVSYNVWSNMGSLDVQPGVAAFSRLHDGGFQVNVFVNLLASYRRGRRDFSSLELDFPEQLGGGIPWRGATPGGYR